MGIGDWVLVFCDCGFGPISIPQLHNPQSPLPNPQSPIPNPHVIFDDLKLKKYL